MQYTDRVRQYNKTMPLAEAVEMAVDHCIREGILSDFLQKNRSEVIPMSIFEYDEEKHLRTVRREGYEDGVAYGTKIGTEQGMQQGMEQGMQQGMEQGMQQGMEQGMKQGMKQGMNQGMNQGMEQGKYQFICNMLRDHQPPELISKYVERPLEYVHQIEKKMLNEMGEDCK